MRITGGELRGRKLVTPAQGVRPTQERAREAMFSSVLERLPGARVLDLYAGTGALGLEAWSRGAESVQWIENNRRTFRQLRDNVSRLCGEAVAKDGCFCVDADTFLSRLQLRPGQRYDLVFADPPYDPDGERTTLEKTLQQLSGQPTLKGSGLLVYEQSSKESVADVPGWIVRRNKTYGSTRLLMYQPSTDTRAEETL